MKNLLLLIFLSLIFPAYYAVGDTINVEEHLNHPLEICHGLDENETGSQFTLADNVGKITVIGLEIPW